MHALALAVALGVSCANPVILSANVQSMTTSNGLNHYTIAIAVQNQGGVTQPGNLLQSIDVFQAGGRVDEIGLQPLRPGQSQKVMYRFNRSDEAGDGTTDITFTLDFNGRSGNNVDCPSGNKSLTITV